MTAREFEVRLAEGAAAVYWLTLVARSTLWSWTWTLDPPWWSVRVVRVPLPPAHGRATASRARFFHTRRPSGLLHCIFFVRAFGHVKPVDCELEGVDGVAYARIDDDELDALIKNKARQFLDLQIAGKSTGEIAVSFFQKKAVKHWLGSKQMENVCWERWLLRFHFTGMGAKTGDVTLSPVVCEAGGGREPGTTFS